MYPLLLIISLILHALAFYWIIILSIRLKKTTVYEEKQLELQKEIEELFQSYLNEMKEENKKLLAYLKKDDGTNKQVHLKQNRIEVQKDKLENSVQKVERTTSINKNNYNEENFVPPVIHQQDKLDQSLESQVVFLFDKGLKVEEIAKKLNKGKTEIELLLKFRSKNNINT
ncbi:coupling factor for flagellin transcription and translation [Calidifontibacillus erzurumensis]|uniref:Coupling factor for flagellin transcription and translation n=1 Tax=Calidifontibacillus erzurumensis TaxID=2741433 RepID=A0A8J8KB08_9BACI|nr:coupling factor for flagellin transcription and translation [Calidifontibacillus erzurumensis]NSL51157.1 coupling factor for flagellin transcription and translation [Calidifontibacillus erzurumensis]